jgi:protein-tyrosine phosphatase
MTERRTFDWNNEDDFAALPTESANEVVPHLIQADADLTPERAWQEGASVVVNLAGWMKEPVKMPDGCMYLAWSFDDDPKQLPDTDVLRALAKMLAERVRAEQTVVIYCAGGLNRSGLLVGQTLIELGHSPAEAIELVRAARGRWALSNALFESFLLDES